MTRSVRLVVVDDHDGFRRNLRRLLETAPGFEVVGEATEGTGAIDMVRTRQPDVVLMDIEMPGTSGIAATREIVAEAPNAAVVVLSMHDDDTEVFAAMQAGARGYLLKGASREEIVRAVDTVASGGAVFGPRVAGRLDRYFAGGVPEAFPDLTPREREVLHEVARGRSNGEIARELFLSPKTVRNLVSIVIQKLGAASRAEAIVAAREAGLGDPEHPSRPSER